jgi:hypothetical protein
MAVFFLGYIPAAVGGILLFTTTLRLQPQLQTKKLSGPGRNYKGFLCHMELEDPHQGVRLSQEFSPGHASAGPDR